MQMAMAAMATKSESTDFAIREFFSLWGHAGAAEDLTSVLNPKDGHGRIWLHLATIDKKCDKIIDKSIDKPH